MLCPLCKFEIPADASVCGHCGAQRHTTTVYEYPPLIKLLYLAYVIFAFVVIPVGIFLHFINQRNIVFAVFGAGFAWLVCPFIGGVILNALRPRHQEVIWVHAR